MKQFLQSQVVTTGLAIFSMLFGAGNLLYPLLVGMYSGSQTVVGIMAFMITAVLLPLLGLIVMILFDGDYEAFFNRLGTSTGKAITMLCMIIIGPGLVIPRIVTLSHVMMTPFLPGEFLTTITPLSSLAFALIFLGITFLCTYRESSIVDLLGNLISPVLLIALGIVIVKGLFGTFAIAYNGQPMVNIITDNLLRGYETLDLIGAIFFSSIIVNILRKTLGDSYEQKKSKRIALGFKAGLLGVSLLALVYCGMAFLGAAYSVGLTPAASTLFREISLRILGNKAAIIVGITVFMACLSTAIALSAVVTDYLRHELRNKIAYIPALILVLLSCIPLSIFGLESVLKITGGPLTYIGYPVLIAITAANLAYKLWGVTTIKMPVFIIFLISLASYLYW